MGSVGHGSHRVWRVPALWVQREPALAREESRRIKESDRYRFARSLERFFARPWRVWPLLRSTVVLNPTGLEDWSPRDPVYPSVDHDQLTQAARAHDRDTRAGYIPMWEAVRALSTDAVSRLTDELSGLRWPRRRWLLAPLVLVRFVFGREPFKPREAPLPPPSIDARASSMSRDDLPPWSALGPDWFVEMLSFEGIERAQPGKPSQGILTCWPGADPDSIKTVEGNSQIVVWVLDDSQTLPPGLRTAERIYAVDPTMARSMSEQLGRRVRHLPPMVQPRLMNPIGWWGGSLGVCLRNEQRLPAPLSSLAALARGEVLSAQRLNNLEDRLEASLDTPETPTGTRAAPADRERFIRSRQVLTELSVAAWLARIEADLGRETVVTPPLVSLIVPTYRPALLPRILACVKAQAYRPIELVVLLHGWQFETHTGGLGLIDSLVFDTRVLRRPRSETLGSCLQVACEASRGDILCRMDDDNWYGPSYAGDLALTLSYSDAGVVAKTRHVFEQSSAGRLYETSRPEFIYTRLTAGGGRMAFRRKVLQEVSWRPMQVGSDLEFMWDCFARCIPQLAVDRFNFVRYRGQAREHTWTPRGSMLKGTPLPIGTKREDFAV